MGLVVPLGLGFLALALPVALLYMLKLRRQETPVSSTYLWMQALRDLQANAPWQRLRRNLLLLLQMLILALLAVATARPFYESPSLIRGNLIVLLDGSASMQATDVSPSRFDAAKSIVSKMVDDLGPDDRMTLVLVTSQVEVVVSGSRDGSAIKSALAALRAKNEKANFGDALSLGLASAVGLPNSSIIVVSDGRIGEAATERLPVPVRFLPVGASSENAAILSVALRDSSQGVQLFLALANFGEKPQQGRLGVYVDGRLYDSRDLILPPNAESGLTWTDLPQDAELAQARLDIADHLAADNAAWALRSPGGPVKTLLVSSGNLFLERALALLPNVELSKMLPDSASLPGGFDLYVLDGVTPPEVPSGGAIYVDPASSNNLFRVVGEAENLAVTKMQSDDPLLRFVEAGDLRVLKARQIETPVWGKVLLQSGEVPLLVVGEKDGRPVAILPFDLHGSNLPLLTAFPILTANLIGWMGHASGLDIPPAVKPGDPISLSPDPRALDLEVRRPDGSWWRVPLGGRDEASVNYAETEWLGVYEVRQHLEGGDIGISRFVVNFSDPEESNIAPSTTIRWEGEGLDDDGEILTARRELWWPLVSLALLILIVEWWVDQRRYGRREVCVPLPFRKGKGGLEVDEPSRLC